MHRTCEYGPWSGVVRVKKGACGYDTSSTSETVGLEEWGLWKSEGGCIKALATWKGQRGGKGRETDQKGNLRDNGGFCNSGLVTFAGIAMQRPLNCKNQPTNQPRDPAPSKNMCWSN